MNTYELIAPCHFGLEAVLKREIYDLGYEIVSVENGKVTFTGDAEAICRANINLRTAERVLLQNFLIMLQNCRGKNLYRRTESFGLRKQIL